MILMSSTDTPLYRKVAPRYPRLLGYMVTPRKRGRPSFISKGDLLWCADNDVFNGKFDASVFVPWLMTLTGFSGRCAFVAAPDVVANARETLKRFSWWGKSIRGLGFPVALVLQDGMVNSGIPWSDLDAVFVGGSTEWKMSQDAIRLLIEARARGKWCHVGRVNSHKRMFHFWDFADSFDGTGFAIEPDGKLYSFLPEMLWRSKQLRLF